MIPEKKKTTEVKTIFALAFLGSLSRLEQREGESKHTVANSRVGEVMIIVQRD